MNNKASQSAGSHAPASLFDRTRQLVRDPTQAFAMLVLLVATSNAMLAPIVFHDNWAYHFPFSARMWNIGGGAETFGLDRLMEARWVGFPKLWPAITGFLWAATGSLRAMIVPQVALCAAYFLLVPRILKFPRHWLVLGFFASPMLLLHYHAIYVDLAAGLCLAIGFFLLTCVASGRAGSSKGYEIGAILSLGMAGNLKLQSFLASAIVIFAVLITSLLKPRWSQANVRLLIIGAIAISVSSASAVHNMWQTGNPFYPMSLTMNGHTVFQGPEDPLNGANPPKYAGMSSIPQPVAFALSATEIDGAIRGVPSWYALDSRHGDTPRVPNMAPSRTGGWGWLFVLLNGALLILQVARFRKESDPLQRQLVIAVAIMVAMTALLPRSHELRYWLYLPLIMLPINLRFLAHNIPPTWTRNCLVIVMVFGFGQVILTPATELVTERLTSQREEALKRPPAEIRTAVRDQGISCSDSDPQLFRYSQAVTGNRIRLSLDPNDCAGGVRGDPIGRRGANRWTDALRNGPWVSDFASSSPFAPTSPARVAGLNR